MKRTSIILVLFLCTTYLGAQKSQNHIGVSLTPSWTTSEYYTSAGFGYGAGLFYDHQLIKRLGVSTGINYMQVNYTNFNPLSIDDIFQYPIKAIDSYDLIEIPILLTFNLSAKDNPDISFTFIGGYSVAQMINKKRSVFFPEYTSHSDIINRHLIETVHFANIGLEIGYTINDKITLRLAGLVKNTSIYDQRYGQTQNWSSYIKLGRKI